MSPYKAKVYDLNGLVGISDKTLEVHFKLYAGYVQQVNLLTEKIAANHQPSSLKSDLEKQLKFERGGLCLHEAYFENLQNKKSGAQNKLPIESKLFQKIISSFQSFASWKSNFFDVGKKRGVGWAICCLNPADGLLSNQWISLHDMESLQGLTPILVMDVWEHAYFLDIDPTKREDYINAFFANIDWSVLEQRLLLGESPNSEPCFS